MPKNHYICRQRIIELDMETQKTTLPIVAADEWLKPVEEEINLRHNLYLSRLSTIEKNCGSITDYANGYKYFGWQWDDMMNGWWFREWLP